MMVCTLKSVTKDGCLFNKTSGDCIIGCCASLYFLTQSQYLDGHQNRMKQSLANYNYATMET